jgi:hypothetical protein
MEDIKIFYGFFYKTIKNWFMEDIKIFYGFFYKTIKNWIADIFFVYRLINKKIENYF